MSDIFLSYSSYNRTQATALAGEIRSAGHDVWMDQGGIGGAQDWSSEIVEALNRAKTVLFLISKDSVTSHNCAKEIHLANEKHKNILPVVLEETPLPVLFEYPLAGLQRVPYERTDAILQALEVLKSGKTVLEAMLSQSRIDDGIIRLAILPFHDLSPGKDNDWFADGMMDELISTLGSLKRLKVPSRTDVMYYKLNRPKAQEIAADLNVGHFVEGSVMKSGEKIRINASLIDAGKNEQLWNGKYTGTFDDIFDFQEQTAKAITEALRITLTPEDEEKIEKKDTEVAEAYELYLKAMEHYRRHTREDWDHAITLFDDAIKLDGQFADAYLRLGILAIEYYAHYSHEKKWTDLTEASARKAEEIEGISKGVLRLRSILAHHVGKPEEALAFASEAVKLDPEYASGYDAMGWAYQSLGRLEESVWAREQDVGLRATDHWAHHSLVVALNELGIKERTKKAAQNAIPVFERHLRFNRDDASTRAKFIFTLGLADEHERAQAEAEKLLEQDTLDGVSLYNLACFYLNEHLPQKSLPILRLSIERGFHDLECFQRDPDLDQLRGTPELDALIQEVERLQ